jgi:hypothetical protein
VPGASNAAPDANRMTKRVVNSDFEYESYGTIIN